MQAIRKNSALMVKGRLIVELEVSLVRGLVTETSEILGKSSSLPIALGVSSGTKTSMSVSCPFVIVVLATPTYTANPFAWNMSYSLNNEKIKVRHLWLTTTVSDSITQPYIRRFAIELDMFGCGANPP
jgi:hypothetical protein